MKTKLQREQSKKTSTLKKSLANKKKDKKSVYLLRRKGDKQMPHISNQLVLNDADCGGVSSCRSKAELEKIKGLSDNELIVVAQAGQTEAYQELLGRYQRKLFVYLYHLVGNKEEVEDLLQNVFSKTYKNISHFDIERKFSSWIYRIAHNEAVNFLKRKSKRYTVSWEDITTSKDKLETATNEEPPEEKWLHQEITKEIDEALAKLPRKYQQVLKLRYFQEYSYEDISKILDKPVNTVGTLINRAKKKLLEIVKEDAKN